ncbi:NAD(P)H-dependent glycerol-3-phosphate dehydrogenase [Pararhizobium haloflavum]|uniref:NAD(P)H-dependent glycerol-3-phosphate dehydrogenase n=1 Tax=Pararhizobium haloflavum TaxID=2037914 RepID=UPI000C180E25|nr:NAD(P)H-dependent glycerol-3-phosphate dehydrogenase [Pararhizobium haloflavum]
MSGIAVIGAGAFGTALACVIARSRKEPVTLLARDPLHAETMRSTQRNEKALPGIKLPEHVIATADPDHLTGARRILLAVPSQAQAEVTARVMQSISGDAEFVICAKGLERTSEDTLSHVVGATAPGHPVTILSGPGFAADIARGLPTAMTVANTNRQRAEQTAAVLSGDTFRLYATDDVTGVELGGALKNVLAIASGITEGAALGQSARAALIARGLAEMTRFAVAHGARAETMSGLAGLGDLVLTATSTQSRNYRYGVALGRGARPADLMRPGEPLSEGAFTAAVAATIARRRAIDMPITTTVADIVDGRLTIGDAVAALMRRPLRHESDSV